MDIIQQIRRRQTQLSDSPRTEPPEHKPDMLYIGCADARLAIDSDIGIPQGKAMIYRNIAALVPEYTSNRDAVKNLHISVNNEIPEDISVGAILEFYLNGLPYEAGKKKQIVVSGHTNCGGIFACQHGHGGDNQDLSLYLDALNEAHATINNKAQIENWDDVKILRELEKQSVRQSVTNLMTYPVVKKTLAAGNLEIHGWLIDTATHRISEMNKQNLQFEPM